MHPELRSSATHVFVDSVDDPYLADVDRHHVTRVLRLRSHETVSVSDGRGAWRTARLDGDRVVPMGEVRHVAPPRPCTIVSAVPKGDRLDVLVQKLTEIGVTEIVLADMERSVVRWAADRADRQRERLERIVHEAASQARRVWLPTLVLGETFDAAIRRPGATLAEPSGTDPLSSCMVIGPEGGFSVRELSSGIPRASLGDTILRVETAGIVAAVRVCCPPTVTGG